MTSRVFVVHQPTGRDPWTHAVKPTMDLSPALEYGELRFILRDFENPFANPQASMDEVQRVLEEESFCAEDWVLLVGNPVLIGMVAAAAARRANALRMLQWNRTERRYMPVVTQVD